MGAVPAGLLVELLVELLADLPAGQPPDPPYRDDPVDLYDLDGRRDPL